MGDELANVNELLDHTKSYGKCVILDAEHTVFLVQFYPNVQMVKVSDGTVTETEEVKTEDMLVAVTLDADSNGLPLVWASNMLRPFDDAKLPVFPVDLLANR